MQKSSSASLHHNSQPHFPFSIFYFAFSILHHCAPTNLLPAYLLPYLLPATCYLTISQHPQHPQHPRHPQFHHFTTSQPHNLPTFQPPYLPIFSLKRIHPGDHTVLTLLSEIFSFATHCQNIPYLAFHVVIQLPLQTPCHRVHDF